MEAPVKRSPQSASVPTSTGCSANGSAVLERFASLLGTKRPNPSLDRVSSSTRMKELTGLLSPSTGDDEVVLTVPSLDLRLTEGEQGKNEVLPQVGAHAASTENPSAASASFSASSTSAASIGETLSRPNMAASVLSLASDGQAVVEPNAAQNIGKRTSWTRSTVSYASGAVGVNISDSFTTLLNSRLRAWTLLLLRHSLSTGSGESRSRLLSMLVANIQVKSVETTFKTLPLPDAAKGAKPKDSDIILPLLFEVNLHTTIQDKPEMVTLRAPGTISAIFDGGVGLKKVSVQIEKSVVLKSMVDQARMVVLKAVASATNIPVPVTTVLPKKSLASKPLPAEESASDSSSSSATVGTFQNSTSLSPATEEASTRLQKARTSALRLNSVLHGRSLVGSSSTNSLSAPEPGVRKVRSVRWDHPIQAPRLTSALAPTPNPNKIRVVHTANKLKSFKSFGRPHAGDFGSGPRNATFGEYGRPANAGMWGRDGRLAAHPMPGQNAAVDTMGNMVGGSADKNATFDNLLHRRNSSTQAAKLNPFLGSQEGEGGRSAAASGAALLGRTTTPAGNGSPTGSSIPRTATALESSLLNNWT